MGIAGNWTVSKCGVIKRALGFELENRGASLTTKQSILLDILPNHGELQTPHPHISG